MTEWTRVAYQMDRKPFPFRSEILASQRLRNHFLIIIIVLMITWYADQWLTMAPSSNNFILVESSK
jgi:hypothetical protein